MVEQQLSNTVFRSRAHSHGGRSGDAFVIAVSSFSISFWITPIMKPTLGLRTNGLSSKTMEPLFQPLSEESLSTTK